MKHIKDRKYYNFINSDEFIEWFGHSVMMDNNLPKLYYHATNTNFEDFDIQYSKNGWLGKGFYFADNKQVIKEYGKKILQVFLKIENPFYVKGDSPSDIITELKNTYGDGDINYILIKNNHDGIIFNHWDKGFMCMCLYPNQIKFFK